MSCRLDAAVRSTVLLNTAKDRRVQLDRRRELIRITFARGLGQPVIRSAIQWKVASPIGLIFEIILGRFVFQFAVNQVLQRAEEGRRDAFARNNCRVNSSNPIANQRNAGCVGHYVVHARE